VSEEKPYPEIDALFLERALAAHAERLSAFDALDTKAGITFGFSAALVALAVSLPAVPMLFVAVLAVAAAAFSATALTPRGVGLSRARALFDKYQTAPPTKTRLDLLAATLRSIDELDAHLEAKAGQLFTAFIFLGFALTATFVGVVIEGVGALLT
jgi:hypothetical protein